MILPVILRLAAPHFPQCTHLRECTARSPRKRRRVAQTTVLASDLSRNYFCTGLSVIDMTLPSKQINAHANVRDRPGLWRLGPSSFRLTSTMPRLWPRPAFSQEMMSVYDQSRFGLPVHSTSGSKLHAVHHRPLRRPRVRPPQRFRARLYYG